MTFVQAMLTTFKGLMMLIGTILGAFLFLGVAFFLTYVVPRFFWFFNPLSFWIYAFTLVFFMFSFVVWLNSRLSEEEKDERPHSL